MHVTVRVVPAVGRLRRGAAYRCINDALLRAVVRDDFRVVHVSIQANHLHLLVEADDARALARGMQAFEISAARRLNRRVRRRGRVFVDRYHARAITTPRGARHALAYVLNNWRRHREDRGHRARVDPYSSGVIFDGWKGSPTAFRWPRGYQALAVAFPTTWLLERGWRRYGRIAMDERPGPGPRTRGRGSQRARA